MVSTMRVARSPDRLAGEAVRMGILSRTLEERHVDVVSSVLEPAIIDTPGDRSGST